MSRFKVSKPNNEVRLREWEPGRVAQLRLFLSHLNTAVDSSLAAQVAQSPRRTVSEFVPKVVTQDVTVQVEYREIRMEFSHPKGLKNFLLYEYQFSTTERFFQFDAFQSPDPYYVFPNLDDFTTYYFRVRVVSKKGEIGPWSDTFSATTPFTQGFGLLDGTETESLIIGNEFFPVFVRTYTAIGGSAYYSIDYEIEAQQARDTLSNLHWTDVELQWLVDDAQVGQNFLVSAYATASGVVGLSGSGEDFFATTHDIGNEGLGDALFLPGPFTNKRRGTFVQKFTALASGDREFKLQARIINPHPTNNDFYFNPDYTLLNYGSNALIKLKNFNVFEVLTS